MKDIQQTELIKNHTVDIYDSTEAVAEGIAIQGAKKVTLHARVMSEKFFSENIVVKKFIMASAAALTNADVCLLDGSAIKVLAVRYPSDAQYVLARIALRSGWIIGLPGLIRRLIHGRIKLGGIIRISDSNNQKTLWLLINRTKKTTPTARLLLPKSVGVTAFLKWLRTENVNYVVPRFYEPLPELHREGGDLDLLVADSDAEKVVDYIKSLSGQLTDALADSVPIGMHSVSLAVGVPYYPPPLARQILDRAIDGPAGSRIPEPLDALHAFIYHALYHHKGYSTNIPSTQAGRPEHPPENDYGGIIQRKAKELGIEVGTTMEEMDEYMAKVGWQPKRDTLAKIAEKNMWVRDRFFSQRNSDVTGLTVFMLKERAIEKGLMESIVNHLRNNGLIIIHTTKLSDEQKKNAANNVRGGNWAGPGRSTEGLLPAGIVIAVDLRCANLSPEYAGEYERAWSKIHKAKIRQVFDEVGEASLVHAADNTQEAWEYIDICLPEEVEAIREKVKNAAKMSYFNKVCRMVSPMYISHTVKFKARDFVMKKLS